MPKFDHLSDEELTAEYRRLTMEGKPIHAWPLGKEIIRRGKEKEQQAKSSE